MTRLLSLIAIVPVVAITAAAAQSPSRTFEVVSIKPTRSDSPSGPQVRGPGRFAFTNVTLKQLIGTAYQRYGFDNRQVIGGPDWIESDHFDVLAQADPSQPITDASGFPGRLFEMMQAMLVDRFQLKLHTETRERPIYELTMAKAGGKPGPKLVPSTFDCAAQQREITQGKRPELRPDGLLPCAIRATRGQIDAATIDMRGVVGVLGNVLGRPVIDRTGLTGTFDVSLQFQPDFQAAFNVPPERGGAAPPTDAPSIFAAVQEQLGLKLESTRGPVDVLVVDRAERPTEN